MAREVFAASKTATIMNSFYPRAGAFDDTHSFFTKRTICNDGGANGFGRKAVQIQDWAENPTHMSLGGFGCCAMSCVITGFRAKLSESPSVRKGGEPFVLLTGSPLQITCKDNGVPSLFL
jgi:hypothetical protein